MGNLVKRTASNHSADNSSNASSTKPRSYNGPIRSNLIKPSYKAPERRISDPLTRTTPAMKTLGSKRDQGLGVTKFSPHRTGKPPVPSYVAPVRAMSPGARVPSLNRLSQPKLPPQTKPQPVNARVGANTITKPQPVRKPLQSQPKVQGKREMTQKEKNIFSKIDEIKSKLQSGKKL